MDQQQEELERRAVRFAGRWGCHEPGVAAMMAAFAAESLRDRSLGRTSEFELPENAEFSCDADEGSFHLRWVAPDRSRSVHLHIRGDGRIHVGESALDPPISRPLATTSVQSVVGGAGAPADGRKPVDVRKAAEAQLYILDHWGSRPESSVSVTTVVFRNAAFTIRKLIEALGGKAAQAR